jgi:death-on-curing protein
LAEALVIAEAVTGMDHAVLAKAAGVGLLDSALHAPQSGSGGYELYPEFADKAAVLAVQIARNHPPPDGNKRLAWGCLTMFCLLNGRDLKVDADDAVNRCSPSPLARSMKSPWPKWLSKAFLERMGLTAEVGFGPWFVDLLQKPLGIQP